MRGRSVIAATSDAVARGMRLRQRMETWPPYLRPSRPAEFCTACLPLLPLMFVSAVPIPGGVELHHPDVGTVRLNTNNWRWSTVLGCAEGRGLIALWAWRYDIHPSQAHIDMMCHLESLRRVASEAPAKRTRRRA